LIIAVNYIYLFIFRANAIATISLSFLKGSVSPAGVINNWQPIPRDRLPAKAPTVLNPHFRR